MQKTGGMLFAVLIIGIVLFAFWHWGYRSGKDSVIETVRVVHTVTRDTVHMPGETVYVEVPIDRPVHVRDTVVVFDSVEVSLPVHLYVNLYEDENLTAEFRHRVAGLLLDFDFDYTPYVQTITVTETIERTIVRRGSPFGVSVDASALVTDDVRLLVGPSLTWRPERRVSLSYGPRWDLQESRLAHLVGVSVRVMGD